MNSPTAKPKNSPPAAPSIQINPEVLVLARQKLLLARALWLLIREKTPAEVVIDDETVSPLWNLTFQEDENGKLKMIADLIPDLTDAQIQNTVEFLLGTKEPLTAAIEKLKLPQPVAYIEAAIRNYAVMADGVWMHPDLATAKAHPPGQ